MEEESAIVVGAADGASRAFGDGVIFFAGEGLPMFSLIIVNLTDGY